MAVSVENSHVLNLNFNLEILIGTYEEFVLGYKLSVNSEGGRTLNQSFTNHSHCGSIRSVAVSRRFLASGSSDESIRLFCLDKRTEHGFLQQHNGTITCLEFYKTTHLFSGSDDGNVCIWNTRTWNCEKTLKAHEGGVTAISVHPSGKLALTVGKDRAMKTWNLIKGRTAYVTNIKATADTVKWSPDGNRYAVAMNNIINIYEVQSAGIAYTIDFKHRINFIVFMNPNVIIVGGEGPDIETHSMKEGKLVAKFKAHEKRVKAAEIVNIFKDDPEKVCLVTASNDGFIKLWQFNNDSSEPTVMAQVDSTCRITSMAVWLGLDHVSKSEKEDEIVAKYPGSVNFTPCAQTTFKAQAMKRSHSPAAVKTTSGTFIAKPFVRPAVKKSKI